MLSFCVPVYNPDLQLLEKCVKSLIEQSLSDWEAVFVLDGPNDAAKALLRRLFKKLPGRSRIVETPHGGAPRARNEAFRHCSGKYVVFWDADCLIEVHAAQAWVDILDRDRDIGFVYSGYKFLDERGAIASEPFDPWLLRVNNYISTCFPLRRELVPGWDESLESLQDWDFWLSVVERGAKGKFLAGYAFSTAVPSKDSISGKGCSAGNWLKRLEAVKSKHNIPIREVCVTSVSDKLDGLALAKMLDADYRDGPNDKPNRYKTIIQIGFSLDPAYSETHARQWGADHKKILFWTSDNVEEIHNAVGLRTLTEYASRLNQACKQYVEDKASKDIMSRAGFQTEILPLPMLNDSPAEMPKEPAFLVECSNAYQNVIEAIKKSLPDVRLEVNVGPKKIENFSGMLHFHMDRVQSSYAKRMLLNGRHLVSNIQSPFCGFTNDMVTDEEFIISVVERVRKLNKMGPNVNAINYYTQSLNKENLIKVLGAK